MGALSDRVLERVFRKRCLAEVHREANEDEDAACG